RGVDGCARARPAVVVDQWEVRDLGVRHELAGVARVTGADGDDVGTAAADLVVTPRQLRGMLAAVQSAEVAQEDEDDGARGPETAEGVTGAVGGGKGEGG